MKLFLILLFVCPSVLAEIYKYVDDQGKTHFTDAPPLDVNSKKVIVAEPTKFNTPPLDQKTAKSLFKEDEIRRQQIRKERQLAATKRAKEVADKKQACAKAKSELARMKQYRAQASSTNSKRYYNKRVDMAKDDLDERCKLSNFR